MCHCMLYIWAMGLSGVCCADIPSFLLVSQDKNQANYLFSRIVSFLLFE